MARTEDAEDGPYRASRKILRAGRVGTLGTLSDGAPFTSLVTPATAPDLSILLLISTLAEHTRHLLADPRCSVLVVGTAETANPQTAPRVTVTGLAERDPDPALKARWLAVHPYGEMYAGFADFALWRIRPAGGLYVGGFGRAKRLQARDFAGDPAAVAALAAAAPDLMAQCNADHADALRAIAQQAAPGDAAEAWRMAGVDVDGCDLARGERTLRVAWAAPVADAAGVRDELARLAARPRPG